MKILRLLFIALTLAGAASFIACTEDEMTSTPPTTGNAPTNLQAVSIDASTIGLRWDQATCNAGYTVTVTDGSTTQAMTVGPNINSAIITGLSSGVDYTFTTASILSDRTKSSASFPITWSPAERFDNSGQGFRLWSTAAQSPNKPSGLVVSSEPRTQAMSTSGKEDIDVIFKDNGTSVSFCGTQFSSDTSLHHKTKFAMKTSTPEDGALVTHGELNDDFRTRPVDSAAHNEKAGFTTVSETDGQKGDIVHIKTSDDKCARVRIRPQPDGKLVGKDGSGDKFCDVEISHESPKRKHSIALPGTWTLVEQPAK